MTPAEKQALIDRWVENFGLNGEWDLRIARQEADHVAGLVAAECERRVMAACEEHDHLEVVVYTRQWYRPWRKLYWRCCWTCDLRERIQR